MSVYLSAGVYAREIDLSLYVPNLSTTAVGMVGLATKGPINVPTFISNTVQFSTIFGDPDTSFFGPYAALQYLANGNQLWYVRVTETDDNGDTTAVKATTTLYESVTYATVVGNKSALISVTSGTKSLTYIVDGVMPGNTVNIDSVVTGTVEITPAQVVSTLKADATFSTYLTAYLTPTGCVGIKHKLPGKNHSIFLAGAVVTNNLLGFTSGTTAPAYGTGVVDENMTLLGSNVFTANGGGTVTLADASNNILHFILVNATTPFADVTVDVELAAGDYTLTALVDALNADTTFNDKLIASNYGGQLKVVAKTPATYKALTVTYGGTDSAAPTCFGTANIYRDAFVFNKGWPAATAGITVSAGVNDRLVFSFKNSATDALASYFVTIPANTYGTVGALVTALTGINAQPLPSGTPVPITDFGAGDNSLAFEDLTIGSLHYLKMTYDLGTSASNTLVYVSAHDTAVSGYNSTCDFLGLPLVLGTTTASVGDAVLTITATSEGTWGNNLSIQIADVTSTTFTLNVYDKGQFVEGYKKLVKTPETITDPDDPTATIANPYFVEAAINDVSSRITVANGTAGGALKIPTATVSTRTLLTGGTNGVTPNNGINPAIYIGTISGLLKTGLQFFRNPEELDLNLVAAPGIYDAAVINEMIDICQTRSDCMAVVDPPFGLTPQEVVDWRNGAGDYVNDHQAFNSSYAALYWPWLQIYDPVNKVRVWTPPSGHVVNAYAYSDFVSEPWRAPAGLSRGHLTAPLLAEMNPVQGDRDLLYENNVNPIATFIRDGINLWGQKTLQTKTSALDRINVRRMLLYLEKVIATACRQVLFEPNDSVTWLSIVNLIDPFLQGVKDRRGLIDYQVRCDATTNTPDLVDQGQVTANILLKPTKAAEFIQLNFVVTAQGTNFSELVF